MLEKNIILNKIKKNSTRLEKNIRTKTTKIE